MRFLCICHTLTPYLAPILKHIAGGPENRLIIAQGRQKKGTEIPDARNVKLKRPDIRQRPSSVPGCWEIAGQSGKCAMHSLRTIAQSGFIPDIILQDSLSGATLGLGEIFPTAFMVAYIEKGPCGSIAETQFRRQLQAVQVLESDIAYDLGGAKDAGLKLRQGPISVNTDLFSPSTDAAGREGWPEAVVCLHGLEETEMERWLELAEAFLRDRHILILMPDTQTARDTAARNGKQKLPYAFNLSESEAAILFRHTKLVIWPGLEIRPELLYAMSSGTAIMAHGVESLLAAGQNCLPIPEADLQASLHDLLRKKNLLARMGNKARQVILARFDAKKVVPAHVGEIVSFMNRKKSRE